MQREPARRRRVNPDEGGVPADDDAASVPRPAIRSIKRANTVIAPAHSTGRLRKRNADADLVDPHTAYCQMLVTIAQRRRLWRTSLFFLVLMAIVLGIYGAARPWLFESRGSMAYDPAVGLSIEVESCDVELVAGGAARVVVESRSGVDAPLLTPVSASSDGLASVVARNPSWPCEASPRPPRGVPFGACATICRVTVTVPPEAAEANFTIAQHATDRSHPSLTLRGVTVGALASAPGHVLPSLSVRLLASFVARGTQLALHEGSVDGRGASLGPDTRIAISGGGSIRLFDVPAYGAEASLALRQPIGAVCVATDLPPADAVIVENEVGDPWGACPLGDANAVADGTFAAVLGAQYDADGDAHVSASEFLQAAERIACCGPGAPHVCSCAAEARDLGADGSPVSVPDFAARMHALNWTSLVDLTAARRSSGEAGSLSAFMSVSPLAPEMSCLNALAVRHTGAPPSFLSATAPEIVFPLLATSSGEIAITLRQAPRAETAPAAWAQTYQGTSRGQGFRPSSPGPKLTRPDAARLQRRYGGVGRRGALTKNVYLVVDVRSSVGEHPLGRWVYASEPALLAVDPAHVGLASGWAIAPDIAFERVRIVSDDCTLLPLPSGAAAAAAGPTGMGSDAPGMQEQIEIAIYEQLRAALLGDDANSADAAASSSSMAATAFAVGAQHAEDAAEDEQLRGGLVRVTYEHLGTSRRDRTSPTYYTYAPTAHGAPGSRRRIEYSHPREAGLLRGTIWVAALAGIAFGVILLFVTFWWLRRIQQEASLTTAARHRAVLARHGIDESTIRTQLALDDSLIAGGSGIASLFNGPVRTLLEVFDRSIATSATILVNPLRLKVVDSVGRFMRDQLHEAPVADGEAELARQDAARRRRRQQQFELQRQKEQVYRDAEAFGQVAGASEEWLALERERERLEREEADDKYRLRYRARRPISISEMLSQYELYCIGHGYEMSADADTLQRALTKKHVPVRQVVVRQLRGLKWKNPREPLEVEKLRESDFPVELRESSLFGHMPGYEAERSAELRRRAEREREKSDRGEGGRGGGGGEGRPPTACTAACAAPNMAPKLLVWAKPPPRRRSRGSAWQGRCVASRRSTP